MKRIFFFFFVLTISQFAFADAAEWEYSYPDGPSQWGNLPGYSTCSQGADQSPIAIESGAVAGLTNVSYAPNLLPPQIQWATSGLQLVNNGHTIQEVYDSGSQLQFEGTTYDLKQFHFHSPSEHIINEQQFPLEVHFVHSTTAGQILVVGVLFKLGAENSNLVDIWKEAPLTKTTVTDKLVSINAAAFLPTSQNFYTYQGSLTTPPCTEGVTWVVMKNPIEASADQLQFLQHTMGFTNNRPVQPLDGRLIRTK